MDIQVESSTIIPQQNPNAEPSQLPFTVFDRYSPGYHVCVLFAFAPPNPPISTIIDGLAKTLVHFPKLTARIGNVCGTKRLCFFIGGQGGGALVVEASVAGKLEDYLPLKQEPELERLHPEWFGVEEPLCLLQVQFNRFDCGGLILGVTSDHRAADGQSMSQFFIAWAQAVRGVRIHPLPLHDHSYLNPRSPPHCDFEHWGHEFKPNSPDQKYAIRVCSGFTDPDNITNILLHYSSEFIITKLKSQVKEKKYTTFQLLLAHLWRKITIARGLEQGSTTANISVNGRSRMKPPVPSEYFGNLVLTTYSEANVAELIDGDLASAAGQIQEAIVECGDEFFRSVIDFGKIYEEEELVRLDEDMSMNVFSPDLEVYSWLGFRFEELDFGGGGKLCQFLHWAPFDGWVVFVPSLEKDGGVDVVVGLLKEHAEVLKKISHSLD